MYLLGVPQGFFPLQVIFSLRDLRGIEFRWDGIDRETLSNSLHKFSDEGDESLQNGWIFRLSIGGTDRPGYLPIPYRNWEEDKTCALSFVQWRSAAPFLLRKLIDIAMFAWEEEGLILCGYLLARRPR